MIILGYLFMSYGYLKLASYIIPFYTVSLEKCKEAKHAKAGSCNLYNHLNVENIVFINCCVLHIINIVFTVIPFHEHM